MSHPTNTGLERKLGMLGLVATGICAMLGASIYVLPFMIQRSVPGIGPYVLLALLLAALPALMAALSYGMLASAMPRAGGSYVYASRGLSPYLGFVASFSQWFGLSIGTGVIAYVVVPFFRDIALALDQAEWAAFFDTPAVRLSLALALLWLFVLINVLGVKVYQRTVVPLMLVMFGLGLVVVGFGFALDHADFFAAVPGSEDLASGSGDFSFGKLVTAAALLVGSFIGFDSVAQAGGEARDPSKSLPRAIAIAVLGVGAFYFVFIAAVYHAVPWQFVAHEAMSRDISAAGMLGRLLSPGWTIAIVLGAAIALLNDLPAMILSISRLMFAWAGDGIFPRRIARVSRRFHTPVNAIVASGLMASVGILGSHLAGDFFLGIDILVTSMMVNFGLMCVTVITLPRRNPDLYRNVMGIRRRGAQLAIAITGIAFFATYLCIHAWRDLNAEVEAWYFHSTPVWLIVMSLASLLFLYERWGLRRQGVNLAERFARLPAE